MRGRLDGKMGFVTGSGQGIGFGIARVLAREGANVWVNDLAPERAQAAVERIRAEGGQSQAAVGSVLDYDWLNALVNEIVETSGQLDILVNNAVAPSVNVPFAESTP